jgi:hypothetical protein
LFKKSNSADQNQSAADGALGKVDIALKFAEQMGSVGIVQKLKTVMIVFEYVLGIVSDISLYLFGMFLADGFFIILNSTFTSSKSVIKSDLMGLNIRF